MIYGLKLRNIQKEIEEAAYYHWFEFGGTAEDNWHWAEDLIFGDEDEQRKD